MARSQMGYIAGDTGYSYVVGYGRSWPEQVHHRDSACTLKEDAAGDCDWCGFTQCNNVAACVYVGTESARARLQKLTKASLWCVWLSAQTLIPL